MTRLTLTASALALIAALTAGAVAAQPGTDDHGKRHGGMHKQMLEKLDANKDGTIDEAEFKTARAQHFAEIDADKDGNVTQAEFKAAAERREAERLEKRAARMLERLDTDKNGTVTEAEFMAQAGESFAKMDRNDDGSLSPDDRSRRRHHD